MICPIIHFSRIFRSLTLSAALVCCASAATAAPVFGGANSALSQDYLTGYAGIFNLQENGNHDSAAQFGLEYRFREWDFGVRPTFGFNFDTDGGAYGYAGINWEIALGSSNFLLIPNFMAGVYHEGDSTDLGGAIEFRSGLEIAYQLENQHRIGLVYNHISNASIYDKNPGAEALLLNYSVPVSIFR